MFRQIYIENAVREHARTQGILRRFPKAARIPCERYTEVFNRKAQSFRLQKKQPALILAQKFKQHLLPTPAEYNIGARHNYYFSHLLNCPYDCRYCFLQGMYRSAHFVLYVNYEDFSSAIAHKMREHGADAVHFFSGYDCDSLALQPLTGFVEHFLPHFAGHTQASLELRTKSTQIRALLDREAVPNCIVAYSLSPQEIVAALEHKTPDLQKRLDAIRALQARGWPIGLRFDPLLYHPDFKQKYREFFDSVFRRIQPARLHSVSLGSFRLPKDYYQSIARMYPEEALFAASLEEKNGMLGYKQAVKTELLQFCRELILEYVSPAQFFPCEEIAV